MGSKNKDQCCFGHTDLALRDTHEQLSGSIQAVSGWNLGEMTKFGLS